MKGKMFTLVAVFTVLSMVLVGCTQLSPSASGGTPPTSGQAVYAGRVEVRVTDAPPEEEVEHVYVTVNSVEIHEAGANQEDESGWTPLTMKSPPPVEFDLLAIQGIGNF